MAEERLNRESIKKAVNWWAERLMERRPHSNGDNDLSSVIACMFADIATVPITEARITIFKDALRQEIMKKEQQIMKFGCLFLGCDYGPCIELYIAAQKAGISELNFPFKTHMVIRKNGDVEVQDGYGQPFVKI